LKGVHLSSSLNISLETISIIFLLKAAAVWTIRPLWLLTQYLLLKINEIVSFKFGLLMISIFGLCNNSLFKYLNTLLPPILEEITIFVDLDNVSNFSFKLIETVVGNCSHRLSICIK